VLIQVRELEQLIQLNHQILAKHTGQPIEKINTDTQRDYFMSPEEAKGYGIIDEVYNVPDRSLISEARSKSLPAGQEPAPEPEEKDARPASG
jgi:hypothetical protein